MVSEVLCPVAPLRPRRGRRYRFLLHQGYGGQAAPPQSKELAGAGMVLGNFHHGGGVASKAGLETGAPIGGRRQGWGLPAFG